MSITGGKRERFASWLDERLSNVPPELRVAIRELMTEAGAEDSHAMAVSALEGFERVVRLNARRDGALELLAADALLTYAFEAAADPALGGTPSRAMDLAARIGPGGRLGRLMEGVR